MNRMMPMMDDEEMDAPDEPRTTLACRDGTCVHNDDMGSCTLDLILIELDEQHNCEAYERAEGTEDAPVEEPMPFEPPAPAARPAPRRLPSVPAPPRR